jgi:hypothetical protein
LSLVLGFLCDFLFPSGSLLFLPLTELFLPAGKGLVLVTKGLCGVFTKLQFSVFVEITEFLQLTMRLDFRFKLNSVNMNESTLNQKLKWHE